MRMGVSISNLPRMTRLPTGGRISDTQVRLFHCTVKDWDAFSVHSSRFGLIGCRGSQSLVGVGGTHNPIQIILGIDCSGSPEEAILVSRRYLPDYRLVPHCFQRGQVKEYFV